MFGMRPVVLSFALVVAVRANPDSYEGDVFPEDVGWERVFFTEIDRSLDNGWFVDFANETDAYRRPLADFAGAPAFFIEWRVETDAPNSILDSGGTPVVFSAGGPGAFYHTTITDARVQLFRDTSFPLVFVDIDPGVAHTYRLELYGDQTYAWYIDGELVDFGVPQATYPRDDSVLIWGVTRQDFDSTTRWDYVRFGTIGPGSIPTVSQWGLTAMTLILLTAGTIVLRHLSYSSHARCLR